MNQAVPVSHAVYEGIEAVRRSGMTNMFDRPAVAYIANEMGFDEAADWLRAHRDEYARAVFHGFEVNDHGDVNEGADGPCPDASSPSTGD